jgi:hypothetical protein
MNATPKTWLRRTGEVLWKTSQVLGVEEESERVLTAVEGGLERQITEIGMAVHEFGIACLMHSEH